MASGDILGLTPAEAATGLSIVSFAAGGLAVYAYNKSPFQDLGTPVFPTQDRESFEAVLEIYEANGISPVRDLSDGDVIRAAMSDKSIINYSSPHVAETLDPVGGSRMFKAKKPSEKAEEARDISAVHGFDAMIIDPMKDTRTEGEVLFVKSESAFPYGVLGFRPSILKLILKGGPNSRPPKWDPKRIPALATQTELS